MRRKTEKISIHAGQNRGICLLGTESLAGLADLVAGRPAAAVIDSRVRGLHREAIASRLDPCIPRRCRIAVKGGENAKTGAELERIWMKLMRNGLPRDGVVVGIGGGTVLDLAGMAASTWARGVEFICAPTTLLAMSDAAIGGKTGLNLDGVKNAVGTFHAARAVLIDPAFLATLPLREWKQGLAEMIKSAVIGSPSLFKSLEDRSEDLAACFTGRPAARPIPGVGEILPWAEWIGAAVRVKNRVVGADFREAGPRRALNLGHTLGHALEILLEIGHGEAVALGTAAAARIAQRRGLCSAAASGRILDLLQACGLPITASAPPAGAVGRLIARDKKRSGERVRWVLPLRIGAVDIDQEVTVREALCALAG